MLQIVKLGSACLFDGNNEINHKVLEQRCKEIENSEYQTVLVVSGAIALAKHYERDERNNSELTNVELQDYACLGQPMLMDFYSSQFRKTTPQLLISENELENHQDGIRNLINYSLSKDRIPIVNYNDAIDFNELRKDNDTLALEILECCSADRLIILGQYDGFINNGSGLVERVYNVEPSMYEHCNGKSKHGNGGFKVKLDVGKRIIELGKEMYIGNINYNLNDVIEGRVDRTLFKGYDI